MTDISDLPPLITQLARLVQNWSGQLSNLSNLTSLLTLAGGKWWLTKADLDADLSADAGMPGLVYADPDPANNGIYVKVGAATTGSWTATGFLFGSTISLALLDPDVFESFKADVTQVIGRKSTPVQGSPVSDAMYIQAAPVTHAGPLGRLKVKMVDTGTITIGRYIVSEDGTEIKQEETASVVVASLGDGNKVFTAADFGVLNFNPGDLIGLAGDGLFTASPSLPVDTPGWRQINAALTDWRPLPTLQTTIRLEYSAEIDQHYQVVLGPAFKAVQDLAADLDARTTAVEAQLDQQWADIVQTIGNPGTLITGPGVADGMYIWANPNEHAGPLLSLDVFCVATGTLQLAKWTIESDGKLHRNTLIDLAVTTTGEANFTPADYGDLIVEEGEYLGLHGLGILAATSENADGVGYWDVNAYATPRDVPGLSTTHRLQARFRIQQQFLAVTAEKIFSLDADIAALADQVETVGEGVKDSLTVKSLQWLATAEAEAHQGPLFGGRVHQRVRRPRAARCVAYMPTVSEVQGTVTGLTDQATTDGPYGNTALRLTTTGTGATIVVAPKTANINAIPIDMTNGFAQFVFKPISNVFANIDRFEMRLYDRGNPGSIPSTYFTTNDASGGNTAMNYLRAILTSQAGVGRRQTGHIPTQAFRLVGAGASMAAITWGEIRLRASTGNTLSIELGNIGFVPNLLGKAKMVLAFDDGHMEQLTFAAKNMERYGWAGVAYLSPPAIRVGVSPTTYMDLPQITTLHDVLGWQIASQAWDTEDSATVDGWSENQFTGQLGALRNWHNAAGASGGDHFSYFSGVDQRDLIAYPSFRKHARSVRGYFGGLGAGPPLVYSETYPHGDPMMVRFLDASTMSLSQLQAHAQNAIDQTGIAGFVLHNPQQTTTIANNFLAMLDWAHQRRSQIDVVTEEDIHFGYA